MGVKSDTLLILSREPGWCGNCRHANHGTVDFREGLVLCQLGGADRRADSACDQQLPLRRTLAGAPDTYFYYEPFDGQNCTWGRLQDGRALAEDADEAMRRALKADLPFIPADGTQ